MKFLIFEILTVQFMFELPQFLFKAIQTFIILQLFEGKALCLGFYLLKLFG